MKKTILLAIIAALMLSASACGTPTSTEEAVNAKQAEKKLLVLDGEWKQTDEEDGAYQKAIIKDDTVEIYWVNEEEKTEALYWAGTYIAPQGNEKKYSWISENDKSKTDTALLASSDDTKEFNYAKGKISYSASAMGVTKTIELEKID